MLKQITFLLLIASILSGCNPYSSKDAERDGHVVSGPAGQANVEKLERFYIRFQSKEQDKLRIVHYTDEGDPVYLDLKSTDQSIQFSRDTSEEKFGGQDKGKKTTVCNQIVKKIGQRGEVYGTEYDLKDCSDDIGYSDLQNKEYFLLFIEQKKN
ncbi:DUF4362 domain-containing protein [Paenibacillus taichungensis]